MLSLELPSRIWIDEESMLPPQSITQEKPSPKVLEYQSMNSRATICQAVSVLLPHQNSTSQILASDSNLAPPINNVNFTFRPPITSTDFGPLAEQSQASSESPPDQAIDIRPVDLTLHPSIYSQPTLNGGAHPRYVHKIQRLTQVLTQPSSSQAKTMILHHFLISSRVTCAMVNLWTVHLRSLAATQPPYHSNWTVHETVPLLRPVPAHFSILALPHKRSPRSVKCFRRILFGDLLILEALRKLSTWLNFKCSENSKFKSSSRLNTCMSPFPLCGQLVEEWSIARKN